MQPEKTSCNGPADTQQLSAMRKPLAIWVATGLLVVMAALMIGPARHDSATVDETTVLGAGYTYLQGHRFLFQPEHPPFSQMMPAIPALAMDIKLSPNAQALVDGRVGYPWTRPWFGPIRAVPELFPQGRDNWYYWALPESQLFGQMFVYDGTNDGNLLMLRGRCVQILLALGVGVLVFYWVRRATGNDWAALAALALWVFNPNAIAHGHLITTDISVTIAMTGALLLFALLLEKPTRKLAIACGAVTGVALVMKHTAVTLAPMYLLLAGLAWNKLKAQPMPLWKLAGLVALGAWGVLLVVYFPRWSPAPMLPEAQANALGVPSWFQSCRAFLIPADYFKGFALTLGHSQGGHDNYLCGEWSHTGWWYYYPASIFLKSPLAFVVLIVLSAVTFLRKWKSADPLEVTAWAATVLFLGIAMTSNVNIGIRHLLPVMPLFCIGIGCAIPRMTSALVTKAIPVLLLWQIIIVALAYPLYLQFFSESVGGARNGYQYLVDSNYDWGQDAKRLKTFLDEHGIQHIYLDYFGTQYSIEYLKIPNTRVTAEQAHQIKQGWLVVSASQLMRPEWSWLRETHQPTDRIGFTLFTYRFD